MSDIIKPLRKTPKDVKVRSHLIQIKNPHKGVKEVLFLTEERKRDKDGEYIDEQPERDNVPDVKRVIDREDPIITRTVNFYDPVQEKELHISIAGIMNAIEEFYVDFWNEDEANRESTKNH